MPDPAFVEGLREELRLRVRASARGQSPSLHYAAVSTVVGRLGVAYRNGLIVYCMRLEADAAFERSAARHLGEWPQRDERAPAKIETGVQDHLAGRQRFYGVDLSWLPPFQRRVLEKTAEIPRGEVRPYAWVAREIGAPGAVRAVGTALGRNPIPFIVPCHRVVRSDGTLGEYSGGGPGAKERVLEIEGVPVANLLARSRMGERLTGCLLSHVVCYPTCPTVRAMRPENVTPFASLTTARASGYQPCDHCRPA
jgi:O-6-methylguanine DNA methyltransferase